MTLNIAGGVYYEICNDPIWNELYGSALRAAHAVAERGTPIVLHTYIGVTDYDDLAHLCSAIDVELNATIVEGTSEFAYEHPLSNPDFTIPKAYNCTPVVEGDLFLQFGAIEGNHRVIAKKVIYDPQSPGNPLSFWSNDSYTDELIWVANMKEVTQFTGSSNLNAIKEYLFNKEKAHAAIIKMGSDGAILIQRDKDDLEIPLFKTKHVWPIGTGDVFSSIFAYNYLIENLSLKEAATKASISTAYYTETSSLPIPTQIDENRFEKFYKRTNEIKKVYLAGPFFNMAQRWVIEQFRVQLSNFGLEVFSPYHDIGLGTPEDVAPLDINAIKASDIIVAIVDGFDPGTIFEIGYARALNLPVIAFVENADKEAITMIKGSDCVVENDFSTTIYKTVWEVYK